MNTMAARAVLGLMISDLFLEMENIGRVANPNLQMARLVIVLLICGAAVTALNQKDRYGQ